MITSNHYITYKFPTQYLSKIALKLNFLMDNIYNASNEKHMSIHQYGLENCLELCRIIEKPELKSRFLKELLRIQYNFLKSQVDVHHKLSEALTRQIQFLDTKAGNFAERLTSDPFIQQLRLSQAMNAPELDYYYPELYLWQHLDITKRQATFQTWLELLTELRETISTYLALLQETILLEPVPLKQGFYQHTLPLGTVCPLILIQMEKNFAFAPKIQYSQNRISLSIEPSHNHTSDNLMPETVQLGVSQL